MRLWLVVVVVGVVVVCGVAVVNSAFVPVDTHTVAVNEAAEAALAELSKLAERGHKCYKRYWLQEVSEASHDPTRFSKYLLALTVREDFSGSCFIKADMGIHRLSNIVVFRNSSKESFQLEAPTAISSLSDTKTGESPKVKDSVVYLNPAKEECVTAAKEAVGRINKMGSAVCFKEFSFTKVNLCSTMQTPSGVKVQLEIQAHASIQGSCVRHDMGEWALKDVVVLRDSVSSYTLISPEKLEEMQVEMPPNTTDYSISVKPDNTVEVTEVHKPSSVPGGWFDAEVNENITGYAKAGLDSINSFPTDTNCGTSYEFVKVVKAKTQVVAGRNYKFDVQVTVKDCQGATEGELLLKSVVVFVGLQNEKPALTFPQRRSQIFLTSLVGSCESDLDCPSKYVCSVKRCLKGLPKGASCTTTGTLGAPPEPCSRDLHCKITDPGNPPLDIPNRGYCTDSTATSDLDAIVSGSCHGDVDCITGRVCIFNKCTALLSLGSECTTSGSLGKPVIPCAKGLFCKITYPGSPERDIPNRGVCTLEIK